MDKDWAEYYIEGCCDEIRELATPSIEEVWDKIHGNFPKDDWAESYHEGCCDFQGVNMMGDNETAGAA